MERPLDRLFTTAKSYISILDGQALSSLAGADITSVTAKEPDHALKVLHQSLQEAHPETGAPYWRVRCWGLVCWQPIYLAIMCVYQLKSVPDNLATVQQSQQGTMVAGYQLGESNWQEGTHEALIALASQQLNNLFEPLQDAIQRLFKGNSTLYRALLADNLLASLVVAEQLFPEFKKQQLESDFRLWAHFLNIPTKALLGLDSISTTPPSFVRQTCCLHFRRCDGDLCSNCPRLHKKQAREHKKHQAISLTSV